MNLDFKNKRGPTAKLHLLAALCLAAVLSTAVIPGTALAQVASSELSANAPSRYVVVKGDTLWAISGRFLRSPAKWPQIWNLNKDHIRNPHLIYPGDVIRLTIVNGQAHLTLERGARAEVRLKPGVRMEEVANDAIPTIDPIAIRPFLTRPLLVDLVQFTNAPRILTNEDGRLNIGAGSRAYVVGLDSEAKTHYAVYRQGPALVDPITKETLALEAIYLGKVRVLRRDDTSLVEVVESAQEIGRGDRLVAMPPEPSLSVALTAAPIGLDARIIKVYDNQTASMFGSRIEAVRNYEREGGAMSVIILNRGTNAGLDVGQVVKIESTGKLVGSNGTMGYHNGKKAEGTIQLPNEDNGQAVVFQTFEKISYALIMKASKSVLAGDVIKAL